MRKNFCPIALSTLLFALCVSAEAQQSKKVSRVGFIGASSASSAGQYLEAFRHGLRDLGYVEGENIVMEVRWAEGSAGRFPHLIAELIGLKVDVLFVSSAPGALAAKNAGITTPVVFATVTDPVGYGLLDSLARPGGNITGQHWRSARDSAENGSSCSRKPSRRSQVWPSCGIQPIRSAMSF